MDVVHPRINRWSLSGVASRMTASGFPCDTEIFFDKPKNEPYHIATCYHMISWLCLIGCSKSCCFRMMCLIQNGVSHSPSGINTRPHKGGLPTGNRKKQWKMAHKKRGDLIKNGDFPKLVAPQTASSLRQTPNVKTSQTSCQMNMLRCQNAGCCCVPNHLHAPP